MSTKVSEKCPKCDSPTRPTDNRVFVDAQEGYFGFWRYECETCHWVWANDAQRKHNEHQANKMHRVNRNRRGEY